MMQKLKAAVDISRVPAMLHFKRDGYTAHIRQNCNWKWCSCVRQDLRGSLGGMLQHTLMRVRPGRPEICWSWEEARRWGPRPEPHQLPSTWPYFNQKQARDNSSHLAKYTNRKETPMRGRKIRTRLYRKNKITTNISLIRMTPHPVQQTDE